MTEIPNWAICDVPPFEERLEEALKSVSIDADLKKELFDRLKQLENDNDELLSNLNRCRMEIDRMKQVIVKLAMML